MHGLMSRPEKGGSSDDPPRGWPKPTFRSGFRARSCPSSVEKGPRKRGGRRGKGVRSRRGSPWGVPSAPQGFGRLYGKKGKKDGPSVTYRRVGSSADRSLRLPFTLD